MTDASTEPPLLRAEARVAAATAGSCRELADGIDHRRILLHDRVEPAQRTHTPEVWASAGADVSRARLSRYVAPALWYLGADLGSIATRLRDEASRLDRHARALLADALELETAVATEALDPAGPAGGG